MDRPRPVLNVAILDPAVFTEDYDIALFEALSKRSYLSIRLLGSPKARHPAINHYFFRLRCLNRSPLSKPLQGLKVLCYLKDCLRLFKQAKQFDIVHMQWCCFPLLDRWFIYLLKHRGIKTVFTVHDPKPFNHNPTSALQLRGWKPLVNEFDHLIVHSQHGKQQLCRLGINERKCSVIHHGILRFPQTKRTYQGTLRTNKITLLLFGEIKAYKGIETLLQALTQLDPTVRNQLHVLIAGRAKMDLEPLHAFCENHSLKDIVTWDTRFIPAEEIDDLFKHTDMFCFPYLEIDTSGVFMSALPYGKAMIASDIGAFKEHLQHQKQALLSPPGDANQLATALSQCLENPALRQQLGKQAQQLAKQSFDWNVIAAQTHQLYQQL